MACFGKWGCCGGSKVRASGRKGNDWRIFSLKELQAATNNFNYDNKLGEGGFGSVYWGQLWDGSQIAVKRLKVWSSKAEMEFSAEAENLGRVRHKNLLNLRGYCAEGQECLVVYDYMPNLSLVSHLHGQFASEGLLDWDKRMNIAIGSAEGLMYLHHSATPHIVHRNVKASNVLLDSEFRAQVADFGFAKLIVEGASYVTKVKGNPGYLAPEYETFGNASESCDVYSFGILLLELVSGRKPIEKTEDGIECNIVDWAMPILEDGKVEELVDPKLQGRYVEEEFIRVVHVATMCVQHSPEERPTMFEVVNFLKGTTKDHNIAITEDSIQDGYNEKNAVDSSGKKHSSEQGTNK